jgi:hypothetical protein
LPTYFLDTSALVKLYVEEADSARLESAVTGEGARLVISSLGVLEFRAALRARMRRGALNRIEGEQALEDFSARVARSIVQQGLNDAVMQLAVLLLDRHPLRAPDALQIASCVEFHRTVREPQAETLLVSSDHGLLMAATAEDIPCWDPAAEGLEPG